MATKRQAPGDRHKGPGASEPRPNKRQRSDNSDPKSFNKGPKFQKKTHPVNELKSRIRDIKRLLARNDNLPANVRVEKERALKSAEYELNEAQRWKRRTEMIERYHKVRFFDRQKATRRLKKARKELRVCEADGEEREALAQKVDEAEVDVNYAQYCPLDQPYASLFPTHKASKKSTEDDEAGKIAEPQLSTAEREGDAEMWNMVKQCMGNGMLERLREGRLTKDAGKAEDAKAAAKPSKKTRSDKDERKGKDDGKEDDGENSDGSEGGFFE